MAEEKISIRGIQFPSRYEKITEKAPYVIAKSECLSRAPEHLYT